MRCWLQQDPEPLADASVVFRVCTGAATEVIEVVCAWEHTLGARGGSDRNIFAERFVSLWTESRRARFAALLFESLRLYREAGAVDGELPVGRVLGRPELLPNGSLRLHVGVGEQRLRVIASATFDWWCETEQDKQVLRELPMDGAVGNAVWVYLLTEDAVLREIGFDLSERQRQMSALAPFEYDLPAPRIELVKPPERTHDGRLRFSLDVDGQPTEAVLATNLERTIFPDGELLWRAEVGRFVLLYTVEHEDDLKALGFSLDPGLFGSAGMPDP